MASSRHLGTLLLVQVLFGLFPVAAKLVLPHMGAMPLLAVRIGGAAFALLVFHLIFVRNPVPIQKEWPRVVLLSLLGVVLNMGMFMLGLEHGVTPVEAVLVITTIPVFTYAIAVLAGKEEIGPRRIAGIGIAMLGVVYLVMNGWNQSQAHLVGDLLILGNALSYAAYLVMAKPLIEKYDPLSLTTWVFLLGALVFIPIGLVMGLRGQLGQLPTDAVWWLSFIVVGASVLTYGLNAIVLRHVPASTVALFTYVQPLFAALFTFLFAPELGLNERLLPAAALVFAGVWLVVRKKPKVLEGQIIGE